MRSVGTGVAEGADASFNEVEDASEVGAGIWTDWKYRVEAGVVASAEGWAEGWAAGAGVSAADGAAAGVAGAVALDGVVPQTVAVSPGPAPPPSTLCPHAWHDVWPRKISVAPQLRHVPGCVGGPCVISSPSSIEPQV